MLFSSMRDIINKGLTEEETAERQQLRREYIKAVTGNLEAQLDNVYLVDDKGQEEKLQKRRTKGSEFARSVHQRGKRAQGCCLSTQDALAERADF